MRSTIPVSVALSLGLHACAVLAVTAIALPRPSVLPRSDLTVVLTMLPTPQTSPDSTSAQLSRDEPATSAAPSVVPEAPPETAAAIAVPTETPPAARVTEAGAIRPQEPPAARESGVAPDQTAQPFPSAVLEARPALADAEVATSSGASSAQAAEDVARPGPPALEVTATAGPTVVTPEASPITRAGDVPPLSAIASESPAVEPRDNARLAVAPSVADASAMPPVVTAMPSDDTLKADDPGAAKMLEAPAVVASATPQSLIAADAPEDDAVLRRAGAFIEGYDGGPCVFVSAVRLASGTADIDGLAAATPPFDIFHQGFSALAGFEPHVTGQKVWSPQCPAVDYLKRVHARHIAPPSLALDAVKIGRGAALHGTIGDPARRPLHLFLITETGMVEDLTRSLVAENGVTRFVWTGRRSATGGPLPQLLVAMAGTVAHPPVDPVLATAFFQGLDMGTDPPGATAKLFLLGD